MEMDRETLIADLPALEALAYDLYVNARFHMDAVMNWPAGSTDRGICMDLAVYYQDAAKRISQGVLLRRLALVKGNTI